MTPSSLLCPPVVVVSTLQPAPPRRLHRLGMSETDGWAPVVVVEGDAKGAEAEFLSRGTRVPLSPFHHRLGQGFVWCVAYPGEGGG